MNETTEGNKLIAIFMGLTPSPESSWCGRYSICLNFCTCNEDTVEKTLDGFASIAKYQTDWDWLMPVVENIGNEFNSIIIKISEGFASCEIKCYVDCILEETILIEAGENLCDIVWQAVVEYIKWFNTLEMEDEDE